MEGLLRAGKDIDSSHSRELTRANLEGVTSAAWLYGWSRPEMTDNMRSDDFLHGTWPQIVGGSPSSLPNQDNLQETNDLAGAAPSLRLDPSIVAIPPRSPLSSLAAHVGVMRVSNGLQGDGRPHDRRNDDTVGIGQVVTNAGEVFRSSDLILLDKDFRTIHQVAIYEAGSSQRAEIEDCHVFFLGKKPALFLVGTRFEPPRFEPVTVIHRLNLHVQTTKSQHIPPRPVVTLAEISVKHHEFPGYIRLPEVRIKGQSARMTGKHQMIIETPYHDVYIVNRFSPLEIFHLRNSARARRVSSDEETAVFPFLEKFNLNGGKMIYLPESKEYLGMVHILRDYVEGADLYGSHYTQAFFTIDANDFSGVRRLGTEFCFRSAERSDDCEALQHVMGLGLAHDGRLILGYSVGDLEARIQNMTLEDALATLQPYSHAKFAIMHTTSVLQSDSDEWMCPHVTSVKLPMIAILVASSTRKKRHPTTDNISLFRYLLPSILTSIECGFTFSVFLGYDDGDAFYGAAAGQVETETWFQEHISRVLRQRNIHASLHLVKVTNTMKKPGPVFLEMARAAYRAGADFFYRVNDDTEFLEKWPKAFVGALEVRLQQFNSCRSTTGRSLFPLVYLFLGASPDWVLYHFALLLYLRSLKAFISLRAGNGLPLWRCRPLLRRRKPEHSQPRLYRTSPYGHL